jgi:hypothetical protein
MRKYHRWLSVFFGITILWIAVTGVLSHVGTLVNRGGFESGGARSAQAGPPPGVPAGFTCPATMNCRPKPKPGGWNVGYLHHLHSGEEFGPIGTVIAMLSGLSLIFFAFSGLWLYIQMFRGRLVRAKNSGNPARGGRFFWS